ncbi:unnamed protein product [Darwinula stevensoni]|uniref:AIG1-type G domain-containing protein n=1 Tax=Darwinula stevensoni TaxID=69355 RepID=A0A7R9FRM6_9CRUS|nr:unnamed protein product [Darwinula stevensoni]CAG0901308.1 unnamed protein product [Darwinula stevensoni]
MGHMDQYQGPSESPLDPHRSSSRKRGVSGNTFTLVEELEQKLRNALTEERKAKDQFEREKFAHEETKKQLREKTSREPETEPISLAHKMKNECKDIDGFIRELPKKKVMEDGKYQLAKYEVGDGTGSGGGKVLMVVGATGTGKSTLIDGIVNYAFNVEYEDDFRFKLIVDEGLGQQKSKSNSQTKWITAYVLNKQQGFNLPYTLMVIDTPGYRLDTEGFKEWKNQIREFFSHGGNIGVDQLDGICFVVPAGQARLTPTEKNIFDFILAVFGNDVVENIFVLITLADARRVPANCAIDDAGIPYKKSFNFNIGALVWKEGLESPEYEKFEKYFWNMGFTSFKNFFQTIQTTIPVSLTLAKEVLKERQRR